MSLLASIKIKRVGPNRNLFLLVGAIMLVFLGLRFRVTNFMYFYLSFECRLIPVFLIILGWGYQPERIQAGFYLILYTLFGSFPLFGLILIEIRQQGTGYIGRARFC